MDINTFGQLISQVGFPIFACCAMGYYVYITNRRHSDQIMKMMEAHNEEIKQITAALNNNTVALTRLCDQLGKEV